MTAQFVFGTYGRALRWGPSEGMDGKPPQSRLLPTERLWLPVASIKPFGSGTRQRANGSMPGPDMMARSPAWSFPRTAHERPRPASTAPFACGTLRLVVNSRFFEGTPKV